MRRVCFIVAVASSVVVTAGAVVAQKGKQPPPILVSAVYEDPTPETDETNVPSAIVPGGQYAGEVQSLGNFSASGANIAFELGTFAADAYELPPAQPELMPSGTGVSVSVGAHNVAKVLPGADLAGQSVLSWLDQNGRSYTLQFGDTNDNSIDYVHIRCVVGTSTACSEWLITTLVTAATPTGALTTRETGPIARLTVRSRAGAKGVVTLGNYRVPFALRVTSQQ
jgi:hypothetical protein